MAVVNEIAAAWWTAQGYTIEEKDGVKQLIGKNAKTGEDEPDKARTLTWAKIEESPDGTFYIASPINKPAFAKWRNHLPKGVTMPEDKEFSKS